jgi:hypothetical protein
MGKVIAEIEGTGPGSELQISIMNNKSLGIVIKEPSQAGPVYTRVFIKKEKTYSVLEALKEYYRQAHNGQLPLWW